MSLLRFIQAFSRLFQRAFLNIAAWELLNATDPPLADLFEQTGVLIHHA